MKKGILALTLVLMLIVFGCAPKQDTKERGDNKEIPTAKKEKKKEVSNLVVNFSAMAPHVSQTVELSVVSDDDKLQSRAIVNGFPSSDYQLVWPNALADDNLRLAFFADMNNDGDYDKPPTDHAWRVQIDEESQATDSAETSTEPADEEPTGSADQDESKSKESEETTKSASQSISINFAHNTEFTDINDPEIEENKDFKMNFKGMTPHVEQGLEVRVIEKDSDQTVGLYILNEVPEADFSIEIPGIIEPEKEYEIDFFADMNENDAYDAPPTDHAWHLSETADKDGLNVDFTHNTDFTDIDAEDESGNNGEGTTSTESPSATQSPNKTTEAPSGTKTPSSRRPSSDQGSDINQGSPPGFGY